jgi:hypothetical protein
VQERYVQFHYLTKTTNPDLLQVNTISQIRKKIAVTQGRNTPLLIVTVALKPHSVDLLIDIPQINERK